MNLKEYFKFVFIYFKDILSLHYMKVILKDIYIWYMSEYYTSMTPLDRE